MCARARKGILPLLCSMIDFASSHVMGDKHLFKRKHLPLLLLQLVIDPCMDHALIVGGRLVSVGEMACVSVPCDQLGPERK